MNYFDNIASRTRKTFTIEEVPLIANSCLAVAFKIIDPDNFSKDVFDDFSLEIKRVEACFRHRGERLKHPVTPFCFLNYYRHTFANIKRGCIDQIIIQAQGEDDFIGYKPSEIAFCSFTAAIRIANPSIALSSIKLQDGLNRCDKKLHDLYKKGINVEVYGLDLISSLIAHADIPTQQIEIVVTSRVETTKIEKASPILVVMVEVPKEQHGGAVASEIIEKESEEATPPVTVEVPKEQHGGAAASEIIEKESEEATPL